MISPKVEYIGKDLEAMDFAVRYHRWILDLMRPYLGRHLVEVGAGTGAFSELLLETSPETLSLVEPSSMYEALAANLAGRRNGTGIELFHDIFVNAAAGIKARQDPDSIIYINVLEHIEDDEAELRAVHETLRENGRVLIFVPALPMLLSKFDKHIGHFRRYRRSELHEKLQAAGFKVLMSRWFDFAGIFPWLIKYRLGGSTTMESGAVQLYDRFAVPAIRPLENLIHPPIGKNLLVVAERF